MSKIKIILVAIISFSLLASSIPNENVNFIIAEKRYAFAQSNEAQPEQNKHPVIDSATLKEIFQMEASIQDQNEELRVVMELDKLTLKEIGFLTKQNVQIESIYKNQVQAVVSPKAIEMLASAQFITKIRKPAEPVADVINEGTWLIGADKVIMTNNTGRGVNVAVIDVGFDISNPEISPNIVHYHSFTAQGNIQGDTLFETAHGTAVSEIITDIAPSVNLYLYNIDSDIEFFNAVDYIISRGDIDIISMSLSWFNVGKYDGTSDISKSVDKARNKGILWVNAAGNYAQRHWSAFFTDPDMDDWNNYSANDETMNIHANYGQYVRIFLSWDETWGMASNDYDLYIFDKDFELFDYSVDEQSGLPGQDPSESIEFIAPYTGIYYIAINRYSAALNVEFDLFSPTNDLAEYRVPQGSIAIPGDAVGSLTAGATNWKSPNFQVEYFSSRGPTKDGRIKPDLIGLDGITTSSLSPFFGTSASAPLVAAAAALLFSANDAAGPDMVQYLLETNTDPYYQKNNDAGTGIVSISFIKSTIPVALSDNDLTVFEGQNVTLSAAASYDPDGETLYFDWKQVSGPEVYFGHTSTNASTISFSVPQVIVNSTAKFQIDVSDRLDGTGTDFVELFIINNDVREKAKLTINPVNYVQWGKPIEVTGYLVNAKTGHGIEGKEIVFDGSDVLSLEAAITDRNGKYSTTGISVFFVGNKWNISASFAGDYQYEPDSYVKKYKTIKRAAMLVLSDSKVKDIAWGQSFQIPVLVREPLKYGATPIQGLDITFNGTGVSSAKNSTSDSNGLAILKDAAPLQSNACFTVQAQFDGNDFYKPSKSIIRDYCTFPRDTKLSLGLVPFGSTNKQYNNNNNNYYFKAVATLKDSITNKPIESKTISFILFDPLKIQSGDNLKDDVIGSALTDFDGKARFYDLKSSKTRVMQSYFEGDDLYNGKYSIAKQFQRG